MSYTDENDQSLPSAVKKMPMKKRKQWVEVFNSVIEGTDESSAFDQAYGVVKEKGLIMSLWDVDSRQVSQSAAGYNSLGATGVKGCANCNWYVPGEDACILVAGDIAPTGLSNLWMAKAVYEPEPMKVVIVGDKEVEKGLFDSIVAIVKSAFGFEEKEATEVVKEGVAASTSTSQRVAFTFKEMGDGRIRFFCWPSNNFKDKHNECIPAYAHKEFVAFSDKVGQYPELWLWHTPTTKFGSVDWMEESVGFLAASGLIDIGKEQFAKNLSKIEGLGMSHGMKALITNDGTILLYRSNEFSVLPEDSAASVAGGTGFVVLSEGEDMAFSDKKKTFLKDVAGYSDEEIVGLEKQTETMSASLKALGYEWKEVGEESAVDLASMARTQNQLTEVVGVLAAKLKELGESEDVKIASHIEAAVAKMPHGFKASEDESTLTGDQAKTQEDASWFTEAMKDLGTVSAAR